MAGEAVRTHIVAPRTLVESVDSFVGKRGRSRFFVEAAEKELRRIHLTQLARKVGGSLKDVDIPGWESPKAVTKWVTDVRQADPNTIQWAM